MDGGTFVHGNMVEAWIQEYKGVTTFSLLNRGNLNIYWGVKKIFFGIPTGGTIFLGEEKEGVVSIFKGRKEEGSLLKTHVLYE